MGSFLRWSPLVLAALLSPAAALAIPAEDDVPSRKLVVLDLEDDEIDGALFTEALDDYVQDLGVTTSLVPTGKAPADHDAWVALAGRTGREAGAMAVLWFEPDDAAQDETYDIYLVLLESSSGAVIVLPIELGMRRRSSMFRVLAATTRMVLDTEILDDLKKVAKTSREDPPPAPWKIEREPTEAPPPPPRPVSRSFRFSASYAGDLNHEGPTVLHGARLGIQLWVPRTFSLVLDIGYLSGPRQTTLDVVTREQRLPTRIGAALSLDAGPTEISIIVYWTVEMLWTGVDHDGRSQDQLPLDDVVRADAGGGLEVRWYIPAWRRAGLFLSVFGQGMAVSHSYRRGDAEVIPSTYFRMGWGAGFFFGKR